MMLPAGNVQRESSVGKRRIWTLLVDDSPAWLKAMRGFIELQKDIVVVGIAMDGSQALEQAEALQPDLILIDVQMPGMNGLDATARLRQKFPETKIIVTTMYDKAYFRKTALESGANGFISKETVYQKLLPEIERIFSV